MKKIGCAIPIIILLLAGCVSSGKYKERLADVDNLKGNVSSLQENLEAEKTENAGLKTENAGLREGIVGLEGKLKAQEAQSKAIDGELSTLGKKYEALQSQKNALKEDNTNLSRLLEAKKDQLSAEIVGLRARLSETEAKKEEFAAEKTALNARLSETEAASGALTSEVSRLKADIESLSKEKETAIAEKEKTLAEFTKTHDSLMSEMKSEIEKGEMTITQLKDKLTLSMVDKILFDSGSAEIKKGGKKVLDRVGAILKKVADKQIKVEGHTDNVPIGSRLTEKFLTNWELSTGRATNVVRYLQENAGIDPGKLIAAGYGEHRPVASNNTDEGKAKNRRIEIVLIPLEIEKAATGN
ncbi:MAG: OmpA family protein [Thermodesulfovibrionales bacterium]|nr:OmpA family protein [Thermodesulfovibrionales bacterium]